MDEATARLRETLAALIAARDRPAAITTALDAVHSGSTTIPALYDELAQLLIEVGDRWQTGELEVWQEHLATATVRTIVEACAPTVAEHAADAIGLTVVLATPPDEFHDVGLRMLADRFVLLGWTAHHLGASVPVDELRDAIDELQPDAVALSVSTHFHRAGLRAYLDQLRTTHPDLRVWVGGAAFARSSSGWRDVEVLDPASLPAITAEMRR